MDRLYKNDVNKVPDDMREITFAQAGVPARTTGKG